jgi:hypothetical protein
MSFTVSFDPADKIVTVQMSGKASHKDHIAARREALRLCRENDSLKLLVDLRELDTENSSVMDCFAFGESFPLLSPKACIAHILPKDEKSKKDVRFTSNVSANRGLLTAEFESIDQARKWLKRLK